MSRNKMKACRAWRKYIYGGRHDWAEQTPPNIRGWAMMKCARCGEIGWRARG